ncbi:MAG TPA: HRDC domain-containing protein [Candidatus Wallbacteria bacterium]|nr:HRDC domain-containing protein [Candidatus Wallbacteria bacterium]
MQYKIFVVPIKNIAESEDDLNRFLRSHRVLSVQKEFVCEKENSFWTFVVEYLEQAQGQNTGSGDGKSKVDYKEVLSAEDFAIFTKLRDLRKEIANKEAIPVYAVFTNEQLAEMARQKVKIKSDLQKIAGVGEAKIEKFGGAFLDALKTSSGKDRINENIQKNNKDT